MSETKIGAVIVAGGNGKRMSSNVSKQFMKIKDKEIIAVTVDKFEQCSLISQIAVVTSEVYYEFTLELAKKYNWGKTVIVKGGKERQNSVYNGLIALDKETDLVLIHDGVRPFVKEKHITNVIECTKQTKACILAVQAKDTIKACKDMEVIKTPDRALLWSVQTPQGFAYNEILEGYKELGDGKLLTDDAAIMESLGYKVHVVEGDYSNIKITTEEDMIFAKALIDAEEGSNHENH